MANTIKNKVAKFKEQRNYKKKLYTWFTVLALVIALSTLWVLVQPANTISGQLICGLEEHTHTEECYERQLICDQEEGEEHTHNEECWEKVLVCSTPEHTHIAECYDVKKLKDDSEVEMEEEEQEQENASVAQPEQEQPQQNSEVTEETVQGEADQMPAIPSQLLEQLRKGVPTDYTDVRTVQFPKGGAVYLFSQPDVIPKQVELKSELLNETSDTFLQAEKRIKDAGVTYEYLKALDISLVDETGAEVEPTAPVYVSIDYGAFLPEEADPKSIQIQHHKEILPSGNDELMQNGTDYKYENPEIILESVMDEEKGILRQMEDTQSHIATFSTASFSTYTITSEGWPELKIKIQCVDEFGHELYTEDKPEDIHWNEKYTSGANFSKLFMTKDNQYDKIPGYKYDGRAYFMRKGEYERQIYGIRRENNAWYYYTEDGNLDRKTKFSEPPNFTIVNQQEPSDFIRLVYRKVTNIDVQYMDAAGIFGQSEIPLSNQDSPNGKNPDIIEYIGTELEIGNVDVMPKSQTYFYVGNAYVGEPTYNHQVVKVIRQDGKPYGVTLEGNEILISKDQPLKLVYRKTNTETPEKADTVPLREKGLKINLFNYNTSINDGRKLQFRPQGTSQEPYNNWTGKDGGIYTGIVRDELENGYPTIKENGESLNYLFDPELCKQQVGTEKKPGKVRDVYTNLDRLFWRDADGYYHYDSMTNFSTVLPEGRKKQDNQDNQGNQEEKNIFEGGDFTVYKQPALPGYNGTGDNAKFLPFDTYANANRLKPDDGNSGKDYHFGMTMEAEFTIPPGGKVADADGGHTGLRDMIFEFNGDDDVWVFIDNKLVLDLGGIHDRYGGKINFRTGEVVTNAPPTPHSGRYQKNLYGITEDPNKMTDEQLKEAREKVGFGKFSHHTFKFFYLERGEGASNCEIRFNLVPVQHGLVVGKRIPEESMKDVVTEHMWYQFQVETEFAGKREPLTDATFQRILWKPGVDPITGGQLIGVGKTDEKGRFWLRAGERADLAGAIDLKATGMTDKDKIRIYVSEILPDGKAIPKVTAWDGKEEKPKSYYEVTDPTGKTRKLVPPLYDDQVNLHIETTKTPITKEVIKDTGELAYQAKLDTGMKNEFNWIDFENDIGKLAGLNITKYANHSDGKPIDNVPFAIKVELWDTKDKKWIPLPEGTDYWILDNKVVKPGDKLPEDQKKQLGKDDNGLISIKNNQSIHMHVLPGTKYRVSEVLTLEEKVVYTTTYEGKSSIAGEQGWEQFSDETGNGIESTVGIQADSQHYVTINNTGDPVIPPKGSFVLMKKTEGVVPPNANFQFHLDIQNYSNDKGELSCKAVYYGSPAGARAQGHEETIVFKPESGGGTYRANLNLHPDEIVVIEGLPEGKTLQVQEIFEEAQDGYYDVSFQEEGKEVSVSKSIITSPINGQSVVKVTCVNRSNLKDNSALSISKEVKRTDRPDGTPLPEELERQFIFQVTIKNPGTVSLENVPVKKILTNGQTSYFRLKFEPQGDDYIAKVELKHKEEVTITELPADVQVVVQELDHDGYAVSMNGTPGDRITVDLGFNTGAPHTIKCVNMTGVRLPETGGHGIMPYFLFGAVMMLSAVGMFLLSSRRKREI